MAGRWAGLTFAAWACACSAPPPVRCVNATNMPADNGFGLVGQPLTVTLRLPVYCADEIPVQVRLTAQDPANEPIPLTDGPDTRDVAARETSVGLTAKLTLVPTRAGAYHFTASFEPNLGLVQDTVLVAEDVRDAGAAFDVDGSLGLAACRHLDVTPSGRLLCLSPRVELYAPTGVRLTELAASGEGSRAGSVVWSLTSSTHELSRWVEGDAGMVREPALGLALPSLSVLLVPGDRDVLVFSTSVAASSLRAGWRGGGSLETLPSDALALHAAISGAWRGGDRYLVVDGSNTCLGSLDAGTEDCVANFVQPNGLASQATGVWVSVRTPSGGTAVQLLQGSVTPEVRLPPSMAPLVDVARWDTAVELVSVDNDARYGLKEERGFVLQRLAPDVKSLTSRWVTYQRAGRVLVYPR